MLIKEILSLDPHFTVTICGSNLIKINFFYFSNYNNMGKYKKKVIEDKSLTWTISM